MIVECHQSFLEFCIDGFSVERYNGMYYVIEKVWGEIMICRIHIVGASGSGTTTLAEHLAADLDWCHYDTDHYFWVPTNPPYIEQTLIPERIERMHRDLSNCTNWVLSGSLCGWGDSLITYFDLVVFLYIPQEVRLARLFRREQERYGDKIKPDGDLYVHHQKFIEWAIRYDCGGMEVRSKFKHEHWLNQLECPVIKIGRDVTIDEKIKIVKEYMNSHRGHDSK